MASQDIAVKASTDALFSGSSRNSRRNMGQFIRWVLLFGGGILMVMPIVFMISTSLKFPFEVYNLNLIPEEPTIENYTYVLEDGRFYGWFINSLVIAILTTVSAVFFDALVGYALCKFKFPGRYLVFIAILSTLMIPTEMLVIPWYLMSKSFGWLDTYWGIMFPGVMTAFGTFLMKQFFETVPDDFLEAARIDGLNEFQIWWQVAMPLVRPALAALAIFVFLGNWTAFIWPLIVTNSAEMYTLPVGLSSFGDEVDVAWELIMTGAAISTLPTLVVFLIFQRFIIRGVVMAGLKG
ncbi:carbohydrate ABC transporter permease [Nitratireductor aquimarinus]|uniref:sn-glycerol-3-phosphate transport system permease protein UgpE n=2 Tax=Phyllobacteriaceae TaxID=69277 RepID=A0ABU4AKA8_9HYPH|nr:MULTISPECIES: carbohydrate ABC transporter permease [Alphaproteobacteria]MBY6021298.1 carbohydrate ABC transporter permease [Nitratireductor sp. DP7N14-4]MBN7756512.1 carbohydrate ABC transporter permease [Nitratireductor aquimarinus]MBN7760118.1 carbohydrate ABC transporter permease [Nitratireductor aquibiodomus]MBN7776922.1 carbohydrate ABC transporter permease [Nitratireductor pacificus]MBN7780256.1 carbohydrate ABC transporter permease [Nitratireductor pacificus]